MTSPELPLCVLREDRKPSSPVEGLVECRNLHGRTGSCTLLVRGMVPTFRYLVEPCPVACDSLGHIVTISALADPPPVATLTAFPVTLSPVVLDVRGTLSAEMKRLVARAKGGPSPRPPPGSPEHRIAVRCPLKDKWFVLPVQLPEGAQAVYVLRVTTRAKPHNPPDEGGHPR